MRYMIRASAWAWPHIKKWHGRRRFNRTQAAHNLEAGNYAEAEKYLRLYAAEAEKRRSSETQKIGIQLDIAEAERRQGRLIEARSTVRQVMVRLTKANAQMSVAYAHSLGILGELSAEDGNLEEATRLLEESLEMEQRLRPAAPARIAQRSYRLGNVYRIAGNLDAAERELQHAIAIHETVFGAGHTETARPMLDLALVEKSRDNFPAAIQLLKGVLSIHEKTIGPNSHEVAEDLRQLAELYEQTGDRDQAAEQYERALALKERHLGLKPGELGEMLLKMARIYAGWGRLARAQELLGRAISLLEHKPSQTLAEAQDLLGILYHRAGRYPEADRSYRQARLVWEETPGDHLLDISENLKKNAAVLEELKQNEEAAALRARAVNVQPKAVSA